MTEKEILEALREHFQTQINNLNADAMAEGPFENVDEEVYGSTWEQAAEIIDARGGLVIKVEFAS